MTTQYELSLMYYQGIRAVDYTMNISITINPIGEKRCYSFEVETEITQFSVSIIVLKHIANNCQGSFSIDLMALINYKTLDSITPENYMKIYFFISQIHYRVNNRRLKQV